MPRLTKDATRKKLRDAVVAEAVEKGIGAVSVAGVVQRAQVSAGTVYVHFENKDEMLRDVYMELKTAFHERITAGRNLSDTAEMVRSMWFAMFEFVAEAPRDFLFLEYGNAAKILTPEQQRIADGFAEDIGALLQRGIDDGTLAPLDRRILTLLLVAPAMQLARSAVLSGKPLPKDTVEQTFERVWLAIAAN